MILALVIFGVLAEFGGLALALLEVRSRRRALRTYKSRKRVVHARGRTAWGIAAEGKATAVGSQPPTVEQRVTALEERAESTTRSIAELEVRVREEAFKEAAASAREVGRTVEDEVDGVRQLLLDATEGTTRATLSLLLLFGGLFLQALANILSVWEQTFS